MFGTSQEIFVELRALIKQLGDHGGLVSPSVYETAEVLRLHPPTEGVRPGLEWLLRQQGADGGWGIQTAPLTRDVPTLAAILTLHVYRHEIEADQAIQAGLQFLKGQASQWRSMHIDLLGVACEMIVPYLIEEAAKEGLFIDPTPYANLFELRRIKLKQLAQKQIPPNSAPCFSYEALGLPHATELFQPHTGVGHSPAATAAWLHSAIKAGEDPALCREAEEYLLQASSVTGVNLPGVMPMAYPITGLELCYGLYPLLLTGLLNHPDLQDVIAPKLTRLQEMVARDEGLGFGEGFVTDVDDTSVAVAVLRGGNRPTNTQYVWRFWHKDHFYTYTHELNASVYSNAHALHALVLSGERCEQTEQYLCQQQTTEGGWKVDKWHTSWRSCTMEVIAALLPLGYEEQMRKAGRVLIADQNLDGSWGSSSGAQFLETVHSIIALRLLASKPLFADEVEVAIARGRHWLFSHCDERYDLKEFWLCKEVFSPVRVDNLYKLSVLAALELENDDSALPVAATVTAKGKR